MERNPKKIGMIFSIMLTLPGTPVIYYGDEFGKFNDEEYYNEMKISVGKDDTRFLVRGKIDWKRVENALADDSTFESAVFSQIRQMLHARNSLAVFGRGSMEWVHLRSGDGNPAASVMAYIRSLDGKRVLVIHNLSGNTVPVKWEFPGGKTILGPDPVRNGDLMEISGFGYHWLTL